MAKAELNQDMIATVAGEITVYNFDGETREYLSSTVEYLAVGVGIPANSCIDAPGENNEGFAICRTADLSSWEYITDHRGQTVYSTETRQQVEVTALGSYPEGTTPNAPASPYDKWDGQKWVADAEAQHAADVAAAEQNKALLLAEANIAIAPLQDAFDLDMATEAEKALLLAWKKYRVLLMRVDTAKPVWPTPPGGQAS